MSRIGKLPISIPAGVTVAQDKDGIVTVKGPKGELSQKVDPSIKVKIEDGHVTFEIDENSPVNVKQKQAFHGLYRALVNNMVVGVSEGYKKEMELVGVGYRVSNQGNIIEFSLGYTHPIFIQLPKEVKVETKMERNQNPQIILVEDFEMEAPKTKEFVNIAKNLKVDGKKSLFVLAGANNNVYLSARNLQSAEVMEASTLNTYKVLNADVLVISEKSLETIDGILNK